MTLQIDSDETARLAQELADLTGESLDSVVEKAVRERLEKEREVRDKVASLNAFLDEIRPHYDLTPISKEEMDALVEDNLDAIVASRSRLSSIPLPFSRS
jgi:hypothetical protein